MSTRTCYSIIKGITPDSARSVLAAGIKACPGPPPKCSKWTDWPYDPVPTKFHGVVCTDALVLADDAYHLAKEMSRISRLPHMELRIQEGDHWDFTLCHHGEIVADFSTRVTYFDYEGNRPRPWKQGDAAAFAKCWGAHLKDVEPYLIDWDTFPESVLVREGDEYPVGDYCQVFDFMRVLGFAEPFGHPERFEISAPVWKSVYRRQPVWRRIVRQVSVSIKGTYPDVPRRTPEQERLREKMSGSVRIIKSEADSED